MVNLNIEINETISNTFANQNILISGCTGFLGKVILEKILRQCPQVATVYLLMRKKKSFTIYDRLEYLKRIALFESLLKEQPNVFEKVNVIEGDTSEISLGLSESDKRILCEKITTIVHAAATVRFDDSISKAVIINLRGTREMLRLAQEMTNLRVFLHVSTAYSNTDYDVVEESVYPPKMDWSHAIKMAETIPEFQLKLLTPFLIEKLPNTYAFTKALAENLIDDYSSTLPVAIVRPSVVTATYRDPIPGWVDNFNGPIGITFGVGIGLVHCLYLKRDILVDYIPADITSNIIMATIWYRTMSKDSKTLVVNACASKYLPISVEMVIQFCENLHNALPFKTRLWYMFSLYTNSEIWYRLMFILFHVVPAFFVDSVAKYTNHNKSLMKIYRKMIFANLSLVYYMRNQWDFQTDNLERLQKLLVPEEKLKFQCDFHDVNAASIVIGSLINGRRFLLNENQNIDSQLLKNYKVYNRFFYVHYGVMILFCYMIWKLLMNYLV